MGAEISYIVHYEDPKNFDDTVRIATRAEESIFASGKSKRPKPNEGSNKNHEKMKDPKLERSEIDALKKVANMSIQVKQNNPQNWRGNQGGNTNWRNNPNRDNFANKENNLNFRHPLPNPLERGKPSSKNQYCEVCRNDDHETNNYATWARICKF